MAGAWACTPTSRKCVDVVTVRTGARPFWWNPSVFRKVPSGSPGGCAD
jgi:hypothetical protein